jgi:YgiT-type zinc finger domain-containing protein
MKCRTCGGTLDQRITDLPFKIDDTRIVVVRRVPVDSSAELEVIRYAA